MRMMAECSVKTGDYDAAIRYLHRGAELQPEEQYWREQLKQVNSGTK